MITLSYLELYYLIGLYLIGLIWWQSAGWRGSGFLFSNSDLFKGTFLITIPFLWSLISTITIVMMLLNGALKIEFSYLIINFIPVVLLIVMFTLSLKQIIHTKVKDNLLISKKKKINNWTKQFNFIIKSRISVYHSNGKVVGRLYLKINEEDLNIIDKNKATLPENIYLDLNIVTKKERDLNLKISTWIAQFPNSTVTNHTQYSKNTDSMSGSLIIVAPETELEDIRKTSYTLPKQIQIILTSSDEMAKNWIYWGKYEEDNTSSFFRYKVE